MVPPPRKKLDQDPLVDPKKTKKGKKSKGKNVGRRRSKATSNVVRTDEPPDTTKMPPKIKIADYGDEDMRYVGPGERALSDHLQKVMAAADKSRKDRIAEDASNIKRIERAPGTVPMVSKLSEPGSIEVSYMSEEEFELVDSGWEVVAVRTLGKVDPDALREPEDWFWGRDELWMFCLECISRRVREYEIRRLLKRFITSLGFKPKGLTVGVFRKVIAKARVELRVSIELDREDFIAEGYETMRQIIADPETADADRIKAQQTINDMLGLSAKYGDREQTAEDKVAKIREMLAEEQLGVDSYDD